MDIISVLNSMWDAGYRNAVCYAYRDLITDVEFRQRAGFFALTMRVGQQIREARLNEREVNRNRPV